MKLPHKFNAIGSEGPTQHLYDLGWSAFFQKQLRSREVEQPPARVVGVRRNSFLVSQGNGEMPATIAGSLIHDRASSYPAVGDWVLLRDTMITSVLSRKNSLSRKAAGGRNRKNGDVVGQDQLIATNLDVTFIVCGLDRDFNLRRIERYLAMVYNCGITPAVILTKADLHQCPDTFVNEVERIAIGVPIHLVSADGDDALSYLKTFLSPGKTAALIGSSGAGKSTLINRLYGDEIRNTGSVSLSVGKGKHTTTNRELIVLPSGGMLIDNPGIREVAPGAEGTSAESAFPDIDNLALLCRFPNCSHTHEPDCQVLKAVSMGQITSSRLKSYRKIQSERTYFSHREKKGAARVEKERWKGVSQKIKAINKRKKG